MTRAYAGVLRKYGDLSPDHFYKGSARSGYTVLPGAGNQRGVPRDPLDMRALLDANLGTACFLKTCLTCCNDVPACGGMDRIAAAFEKKLSHGIRFDASVEQIRKTPKGVRIGYRTEKTGMAAAIEADWLHLRDATLDSKDHSIRIFPGIPSKPSTPQVTDSAYKIAWESRRFWERDYRSMEVSLSKTDCWRGVVSGARTCLPKKESLWRVSIENEQNLQTLT